MLELGTDFYPVLPALSALDVGEAGLVLCFVPAAFWAAASANDAGIDVEDNGNCSCDSVWSEGETGNGGFEGEFDRLGFLI